MPPAQEQAPPAAQPTIHEATRATDGSGAVIRGSEIDETVAVRHRENGEDIVVCGDDTTVNRWKAMKIEEAVGPWIRQNKHTHSAGPAALPHFQQKSSQPRGHSFYETDKAKARKE